MRTLLLQIKAVRSMGDINGACGSKVDQSGKDNYSTGERTVSGGKSRKTIKNFKGIPNEPKTA